MQALNESAEQDRIERLRIGPEGECEVDLLRINGLLHRVRKRLPALCPLSVELQRAFLRAQGSVTASPPLRVIRARTVASGVSLRRLFTEPSAMTK